MTSNTDFDKKHYWTYRKLSSAEKKKLRELDRKKLIVAVHAQPDWPAKPVGKKRAAAQKRRAMHKAIDSLNSELFMLDHPTRNTPARTHCYYCTMPIAKDGVCAGHWDFLFKNMSNKTRMVEKAYHRKARAEELQRKREEQRAYADKVKQDAQPALTAKGA